MIEQTFSTIKSKEVGGVKGYIHSTNPDGTINVCFNLNTIAPKVHHLHKYDPNYLNQYYEINGTMKWTLD